MGILENIRRLDEIRILVDVLRRADVQGYIVHLNTNEQLRKGKDSENEPVGFYKSHAYASQKTRQAGREATFGVIDLVVTGDYYRTFQVHVFRNGDFLIKSNTALYDHDLRDIVGISENLEGLHDENFDKLIDFLEPLFIQETERAIFN